MVYKKGNKYKIMKPMKAKGDNDKKERSYIFGEIYEGHPNNAEHPAALEQVKETKTKKRGEKHGSNKI